VGKWRVFVASDDPSVLPYARQTYPNYDFVGDTDTVRGADPSHRYTESALLGVIVDIHLLTQCDYVVATFSSNIGRTVYELMQALRGDASSHVMSLDSEYFFNRQIIAHPATVLLVFFVFCFFYYVYFCISKFLYC
jgi:glycoprotein 6-alpha-L-fucosyltransferase